LEHIKGIRNLILSVALLSVAYIASAQVKISSPYSSFGIGSIYGVSSQSLRAMGGATTGFSSPYFINPYNPASYMAFDTNSFVFDAAFNLRSSTIKTLDESQKNSFGSLANLYFGFPITKKFKFSSGIMPYSNVGYEVNGDQVIDNVGRMVSVYSGSGGLNKAYLGAAMSPFKNISVGVNMSYLFGNIVKGHANTFPDSIYYYNTMVRSTARLSKANFDFGLIYRKDLTEGRFFQVGLTYNPSQKIDGKSELIAYSYKYNASQGMEEVKDTVSYETGFNGVVKLPTAVGAGFMVGSTNRWLAVADVKWQKWSEFTYLGNDPGLKDNLQVSIGGQLRPAIVDMGKYYERINYRAGFRFEQGYLELQNTRVQDFGISLGVGLPMKKSRSTMNIAVEIGTQGTTDNGLIKENYIRFTIGAALQERWFQKRRFN
jgi:long-subunit fatty acid transport protein